MLGIARPTDRHGLRGGPRRDRSRLDPPFRTLPRSPQPEMRVRRGDRTEEDSTHGPHAIRLPQLRLIRRANCQNGRPGIGAAGS
jgi:hypothetical protein